MRNQIRRKMNYKGRRRTTRLSFINWYKVLLNFRLWQEFVNSRGKQIRKKHSRPGYWSSFLSYGNANLESLAIGLWQRVYSRCEQIGSFRIGSSPCKFILLSSCFNQGAKALRSNESPTADSIATPPPIPTTCQAKGQDRPTTEEKEQSEHESNAQNSQQWKKFFTLQFNTIKMEHEFEYVHWLECVTLGHSQYILDFPTSGSISSRRERFWTRLFTILNRWL